MRNQVVKLFFYFLFHSISIEKACDASLVWFHFNCHKFILLLIFTAAYFGKGYMFQ